MRAWRVFAAGALGAVPVLVLAGPAGATIDGPCTASGEIDGQVHDAALSEVEIPSEGDVHWQGAIQIPEPAEERPIRGWVKVDFPTPVPDQEVGSWDSDSLRIDNADTYEYELPSVLEGFDIKVYGEHYESGALTCSGGITVRLEGGGIGNPATLASLAFTVISVINLFLAIRVKP
ncbi:MAG: hypothetical protein ACT4OX_11080 [Actinomycetota bacterium]